MKHPNWRCQNCGERLYEHIAGGYQCLNCDRRYACGTLEETAA